LECENLARAQDKRIQNSEGASLNNYQGLAVYADSHGFMGHYPSSSHGISCALIASDGHEMERDYEYTVARDPHDLSSITWVARQVAEKTVRRLGAKKLTTRNCPVLFAPEVARGLLGHFVSAISGSNIYRKSSFLLDQLNQPVFPDFIIIDERPHLLKGIGSAPFDAEGVCTWKKDFVKQGILRSYVLGSYSARKLGMQTTGNSGGTHNLFINTTLAADELLKKMDRGLLVTELMGQGVNLVTGDYSRGAFGFWVENGVIQYPVHEITIAGNLKNIYLNLMGVGDDIDNRGNIHTGSILIEEMMIAGQ
jgi:PmbA protein